MEQIKILIGIPDNRATYEKPFVKSLFPILAYMQEYSRQKMADGLDYAIDICWAERGSIDQMRNTIANTALQIGAKYIMWMDSDMTFPPDLLIRMLSHFEQDDSIEAVTGLYTYKTYPYIPHVYPKYDETDGTFFVGSSHPLETPFFVDGAGFGCIMMKTSVLARVECPYFTSVFDGGKLVVGEDLGFCIKSRMKMVLDPQIRCGHLHQAAFGIDDYLRVHSIVPTEDGRVKLTPEQRDKIMSAMPNMLKMVRG